MRTNRISTGLPGLDEILMGGLISQKAYLLQGGAGTGKTSFGLHFAEHAVNEGHSALYITLGESEADIRENARSINLDFNGVDILDLTPSENLQKESGGYSIFSSTEVEQQPLIDAITETVNEKKPKRVVFDSITILRLLNDNEFQYRKLGLALIKFICQSGATLLLISETDPVQKKIDATFWVDGIINVAYTPEWRKIDVTKYRGSDFLHGNHAFKITGKGITVFPRLQPSNYNRSFDAKQLSSGIAELDKMAHGGIEKGTTTLITGPTGAGKTNLSIQFIKEAASRNERSVIYTFEESKELIIKRSKSINIPIDEMIKSGNLSIIPVEPVSYSPDEFLKIVRTDVEEKNTELIMIDSMGGYSMAVREENALKRLHMLTVYLQNMGVTTFLTNETQNLTGDFSTTNMHASYLADNIFFLRYIEVQGQLRKAVGILKKRLSSFENTIREFRINEQGISVRKPLSNLRGILTGLPEITD